MTSTFVIDEHHQIEYMIHQDFVLLMLFQILFQLMVIPIIVLLLLLTLLIDDVNDSDTCPPNI